MKIIIGLLIVCSTVMCFAEKHKVLEKHFPTTEKQRIEIQGFSGSDIRFKSWSKDEVYIKLNVSISSSDDDYEKEYIESAKISDFQASDALRITFEAEEEHSSGSWLFNLFKRFYVEKKISGEIYVPQKNALSTDMRYGTLGLEDMQGEINLNGVSNSLTLKRCPDIRTIDNKYGKTVIENSGGDLQLDGTSSTISISDFNGKARIEADYSTVTIVHIKKGVYVSDKSGKIKVEDVAGDVTLDADYSDMTVKNVQGFVDINSASATIKVYTVNGINVDAKYSEVDISGVSGTAGKSIIVKGQSGSLMLEDAIGDISIDNPYSNIDFKNVKGNINLSSRSSQITGNGIQGNWNSETEYSSVKLRQLQAKRVYATNKSESIDIKFAIVPDTIEIENEYGDVSIKIPIGFTGSVELESEYGSVETNLSVTQKKRGNREYVIGKTGLGRGSISIGTKSADIELIEE